MLEQKLLRVRTKDPELNLEHCQELEPEHKSDTNMNPISMLNQNTTRKRTH